MALPGLSASVLDGQLGLTQAAAGKPLYVGYAPAAVVNTLYTFAKPATALTTLGFCPLAEAVMHELNLAGGSVDVLTTAGATAGSNSAVTPSGAGPTVSIAGTPSNFFDAKITIVAGGALGTGTFKYTLDGGKSDSETRTIPAGGTFLIPSTGITVTFAAGTYVAADTYSFTSTPPTYSAANLSTAIAVPLATNSRWSFVAFTGHEATASAAATMAAAYITHLTTLATNKRFVRGLASTGEDTTTNVNTQFASVASARLGLCYGRARLPSSASVEGFGNPRLPWLFSVAARCAEIKAATNPAWWGLGGLGKGAVSDPSFDEGKSGEILYPNKIMAPMTAIEMPSGILLNQGLLKSPAGSDFRYWQWGRVVDIATHTALDALAPYVNGNFRTVAGGKIDPRDAARIDKRVNGALSRALKDPVGDDGSRGFVTDVLFSTDISNDILTSSVIQGDVKVVVLANGERFELTVGISKEVVTSASTTTTV